MRRIFVLLVIFLATAPLLYAQNTTVRLKSGKVVEGELVERTEKYVVVNFNEINLTFWMDDIDEIDGVKLSEGMASGQAAVEEVAAAAPIVSGQAAVEEAPVSVPMASGQAAVEEVPVPVPVVSEETAVGEDSAIAPMTFDQATVEENPVADQVISEQEAFEGGSISEQEEGQFNITGSVPADAQRVESGEPFVGAQSKGSAAMYRPMNKLGAKAAGSVVMIMLLFAFGIYAFFSFCLQKIAQKLQIENAWLVWIPIANLFLMCKMASAPGWWLILFFIPLANFLVTIIVWYKIILNLKKPGWYVVLMFVPVVNIGMIVYLAFSKPAE